MGAVSTSDTRSPATPAGPGLPAHWWAPAIALHERAIDLVEIDSGTGAVDTGAVDTGGAILARWRDGHGGALDRRLAELGLTESGLLRLLEESPASLCARIPRPSWADRVEQAVRLAGVERGDCGQSAVRQPPPGSAWRDAFARVVAPFVTVALDATGPLDASVPTDAFVAGLTRRLVDLAAPTLVAELHRYRDEGRLAGPHGAARFEEFIDVLTTRPGLAALVLRYPVLARQLTVTAADAAEAWAELLTRFRADRQVIIAALLHGTDPGPLVDLRPHLGDPHEGGRAAAVLGFPDGRRIVYKPRDLECQVRLNQMLEWLSLRVPGLGLRGPATLARPGYGWSEYLAHEPLADEAGAATFYRRLGALLALLHAVHAVDIHCENLIACGDQPVVVDVESLLHHPSPAELRGTGDPAADLLATSVNRTALLPLMAVGDAGILDLSGSGGDRGATGPMASVDWIDPCTDVMRPVRTPTTYPGAANRPHLNGVAADPLDHEFDLLDGFRSAYDAMSVHQAEISVLVESCARTVVRFIARPTWAYRSLIDQTVRPGLLADAAERDLALGGLWAASTDDLRRQLPRHEIADLWRGEVPLWRTRPAQPWISSGAATVRLTAAEEPAPVRGTGLAVALGKINDFSEADRQDQEWIISATLATRRAPDAHRASVPVLRSPGSAAAVPERLVTVACAVADQIVARGIPDESRVNWLGLELVDDRQWLVLPMGAGLAHGYLGVALFLAQLADVTGVRRYADLARRAVGAVPRLFDLVAARPELIEVIGGGALYGFGGIAYALARLGRLLGSPDVAGWTATAVELAGSAIGAGRSAGDPAGVDWATGSAGCLAAMLSVRGLTATERADAVARRCADQLATYLESNGATAIPAGFAAGAAGICWALTGYARQAGDETGRYARAADIALAHALGGAGADVGDDAGQSVAADSTAWCNGSGGLALVLAQRGHPRTPEAARRLMRTPLRADLSLCHGELGLAESLLVVSTVDPPAGAAVPPERAGRIVDAASWHGRRCGTPGGVETPGLLSGLAGIGYGLLRLARPEEVPSVLLLQHRDPHEKGESR